MIIFVIWESIEFEWRKSRCSCPILDGSAEEHHYCGWEQLFEQHKQHITWFQWRINESPTFNGSLMPTILYWCSASFVLPFCRFGIIYWLSIAFQNIKFVAFKLLWIYLNTIICLLRWRAHSNGSIWKMFGLERICNVMKYCLNDNLNVFSFIFSPLHARLQYIFSWTHHSKKKMITERCIDNA